MQTKNKVTGKSASFIYLFFLGGEGEWMTKQYSNFFFYFLQINQNSKYNAMSV